MSLREWLGILTERDMERVVEERLKDERLKYAIVPDRELMRIARAIDALNKHKYNALNQRLTKLEAAKKPTKKGK